MSWPFDRWIQIAIRRFGLSPTEFWAMPLRDWLTLLQSIQSSHFDRADLDKLISTYPDRGGPNGPD